MGRIFGTDGARGVANTEISCTLAMDIGRAVGMVISEKTDRRPRILIGRDTRISGDMLQSAVAAGLCSVGSDVVLLGVVPTPAVAYLVTAMGADAGIMLSASHNPYEFNGIKVFGPQGFKLTDEQEFEIEEIVLDKTIPFSVQWGARVGRVYEEANAVERYITHLLSTIDAPLGGICVALDCSNGSASATAKALFERAGAFVTVFHAGPDGININGRCGSTHIETLSQLVKSGKFDCGFAFDGDADRCLGVTAEGELVDGDRIIAVLAKDLRARGRLPGDTAVVTVMSNLGFHKFCEQEGIGAAVTKVGDRYVLENMLENGYMIGGEQSGHVILREFMTTGDGQLTALQLLAVMKRTGKSLRELAEVMRVYPQVMVNIRADPDMKSRLELDEGVRQAVEKVRAALGGQGRVLVRVSGTEPLIRVMIEGVDEAYIRAAAEEIAQTIKERLGNNESDQGL
ncbi:MAG: phosphoglucosamine mutase [Provencibacterium sp.]|jgi:phosphoglucosamine mutase|nr:phosphoglucosamine mutase [Provencibacterium sp.]